MFAVFLCLYSCSNSKLYDFSTRILDNKDAKFMHKWFAIWKRCNHFISILIWQQTMIYDEMKKMYVYFFFRMISIHSTFRYGD